MAYANHTLRLVCTEEAVTVLFCLLEDVYRHLNPSGDWYTSLKRLSDSDILWG